MHNSFQATLDLVLKASNEGIWDWNVGEDSIYYSDRVYQFLGCEKEDAPNILKHPESILVPEDAAYLQNVLELCLMDEDEELFAVDCRVIRPTGSIAWLRVRGVVVRENGVAARLVGSMIDISKRKHAEESLAEERSMLRLVVDNVPVQVYFKDVHSRFTLVNKRQAEWVGGTLHLSVAPVQDDPDAWTTFQLDSADVESWKIDGADEATVRVFAGVATIRVRFIPNIPGRLFRRRAADSHVQ
ncbi:MAG: PAS domain S-box protein, partial [Rubritalea sp.]|uniref:PAS domain-containing protein n=1 Tax=Rubritalea sp. TaxID=2109375 RepID=UPI0032426F3F